MKVMIVEEIRNAIRERGKGIFIVFSSAPIGDGTGIKHGTGRSSIAKKVAEKLGGEYFSTGDIFRAKAKELKFDINQMQEYAKEHPEVDVELDKESVKRVKEAISKGKILTSDSNLLPYLIDEDGVRIAVDVDNNIRAKRVMDGQREGDKPLNTQEEALEYLDERSEEELDRYRKHPHEMYNGIDLNDQSTFHGVVNNSGSLEESVDQALKIIKEKVVP